MGTNDDEEIETRSAGVKPAPREPGDESEIVPLKHGSARFMPREDPRAPLLHFEPPKGRPFAVQLDAMTCGRTHRAAKDDEELGAVAYCVGAKRKDGCGLCPRRTLLWLAKAWGAFDFLNEKEPKHVDSPDRGRYASGVGRDEPADDEDHGD